MDCDVAVLGGGPGGYTAAIRAAQLGAKAVCIEKEPELGGTCLRVGCIPTKAWVQTAFAIKEAQETFGKLGVQVGAPQLDFGVANQWKDQVVKQMTSGVAGLFKANGVEWVKGTGRFKDANTIAVEGGEDVSFKSAVVATGSFPLRPPIEGLDSARCVDSTGLLAQTQVPRRLVVLGGGIIGCEFASIFRRFGTEVTIIEMLPKLIPAEDDDAAAELAKHFGKRSIALHLEKQCTKVEETGDGLRVYFGEGETVDCDLMLVAVGRGPLVEGLGLEEIGVELDKRKGIAADEHRRTTVPHIYAVGDCAGYWQLAHTAFREGEVAAENATGHDADRRQPRCAAPDLHRPGDRRRRADGARGARAVRRRRRDRHVPVGRERARRDAERDRRLGQVDPRDALRRAARNRHGRTARDRPDRGRSRRARRGGNGRDGRGRDGGSSDALGGDQGGRARRARPRDSSPAEAPRRRPGLSTPTLYGARRPRNYNFLTDEVHSPARLRALLSAYAHCDPQCAF